MDGFDLALLGLVVGGFLLGCILYERSAQRQRKAREGSRRIHGYGRA